MIIEPYLTQAQEQYYIATRNYEQLVASHMRLVRTVANKYIHCIHFSERDELIQEGVVGLLIAIHRFNPQYGCRLANYARYWIKGEMTQYIERRYKNPMPTALVESVAALNDPAIIVEQNEIVAHVQEAIQLLPSRSKAIIKARWLEDKKLTLKTLGERYNISLERVRQIEQQVFVELRKILQKYVLYCK